MAITAEQREARRHHLGSSDAAAILGLDPFKTAADVFWSKVADIPEEKKKSFELGNRLEDVICEWAADRLGVAIERNVQRIAADGIRAANLDAIVIGAPQALEAKFSTEGEQWGDEGSDQVPERVVIQAQHQIAVADLERVWVPALLAGPFERPAFRLYAVNRHQDLIDALVEAELRFWRDHVEAQQPPDGNTVPPLPVLKAMRRLPDSIKTLDDDAAAAWAELEHAKALAAEADEAKELAQRKVIALLGEAEAGRLPDGTLLTYLEQRGADQVDRAQLRACHPDVYAQFFRETRFRVLRGKKPKAAKAA